MSVSRELSVAAKCRWEAVFQGIGTIGYIAIKASAATDNYGEAAHVLTQSTVNLKLSHQFKAIIMLALLGINESARFACS